MNKTLITVLLSTLVLACSSSNPDQTFKSLVEEYRSDAKKIVDGAERNASFTELGKLGNRLLVTAEPLIERVRANQAECVPMLDKILKDKNKMTQISLKEIETQYHEGAALPEAPENCYLAKELAVHPATVIILSKLAPNDERREQMKDEIAEVLAHLDELK